MDVMRTAIVHACVGKAVRPKGQAQPAPSVRMGKQGSMSGSGVTGGDDSIDSDGGCTGTDGSKDEEGVVVDSHTDATADELSQDSAVVHTNEDSVSCAADATHDTEAAAIDTAANHAVIAPNSASIGVRDAGASVGRVRSNSDATLPTSALTQLQRQSMHEVGGGAARVPSPKREALDPRHLVVGLGPDAGVHGNFHSARGLGSPHAAALEPVAPDVRHRSVSEPLCLPAVQHHRQQDMLRLLARVETTAGCVEAMDSASGMTGVDTGMLQEAVTKLPHVHAARVALTTAERLLRRTQSICRAVYDIPIVPRAKNAEQLRELLQKAAPATQCPTKRSEPVRLRYMYV